MPAHRVAFVPLAAALFACAGSGAAVRADRPARTAADYFPLAVGNAWTYTDVSPALPPDRAGSERTVRIRFQDAKGFFVDDERGALRAAGGCVEDRARRLLCAPLEPGRAWTSVVSASSTERYEIAAVGERVETPAGSFDDCVRVRAHNRAGPATDHVLEITYAPGVGPVRIETYVIAGGEAHLQIRALLKSYQLEGTR